MALFLAGKGVVEFSSLSFPRTKFKFVIFAFSGHVSVANFCLAEGVKTQI